jgi:ketosteroid isomerase-like protein
MPETNAKDVVDRYNRALGAKDFASARRLLADDLHFQGPIDQFDRADDYVTAITRLHGMVKGIEHQATLAEGDDVAVFYVLDTPIAKAPVAEWYTVRSGKITQLRAYFDARPFAGGPK